jgi:hypothetical protein
MAIPTLPEDFKEFLRLLSSNEVELLVGDYAVARARMGVPPLRLQVLTSISGVQFVECYAERKMIQIEELTVPVISLARLRRNKEAAGRAKDLADLENLPNSL